MDRERPEAADERVIDTKLFKEHVRNKIVGILEQIPGKKNLVIDQSLLGCLNASIEFSTLRNNAVVNIYFLDADTLGKLDEEIKEVVFFSSPVVDHMRRIAEIIHSHQQRSIKKKYHLILSPRRTVNCNEALEVLGVLADLTVIDFNFDLIPLDEDVLSLELENAFFDVNLEMDFSAYKYVADSIQRLQLVYGKIPYIFAKGDGAKSVIEIIKQTDYEHRFEDATTNEIDYLIIIDRKVDLVTPLCTQLTFEGMIDEHFGIKHGLAKFEPKVLNKEGDKAITMPLNPSDRVFKDIRNSNINSVRDVLGERVIEIKRILDEKDKQTTMEAVSDYIRKFKDVHKLYPQITNFINIADSINGAIKHPSSHFILKTEQAILMGAPAAASLDFIEMMIAKQAPLTKVLRLLCLQCLIDNGLKQKSFDYFRREILHTYGFEHLVTLKNLEKSGLLYKNDAKSNWQRLEKGLKLINENVNVMSPDDAAYAYWGYASVTARLVEHALKNHWRGIKDSLSLLPGEIYIEEKTAVPIKKGKKSVVLVYFIGGVTFSEIAALRYIAKVQDKELVVATTNITNASEFLKAMIKKRDEKAIVRKQNA